MKRYISLGLFLFLAIVVWWRITEQHADDTPLQKPKSKQFVELFMNEFEMTVMANTGLPSYRINGKHLERYNGSSDTEIELPVLRLLQSENQWIISADTATLNDAEETIQLNNNVVMQQQNAEPAVTIRTQNLVIYTKTQIAETRAVVDITKGKSHLNSTGMIFNNLTSALELSAKVNGYFLLYD